MRLIFCVRSSQLRTVKNVLQASTGPSQHNADRDQAIEVILNDRLGKKVRVKCNQTDTIGDLKKLTAAQVGARPEKIRIQKW